MTFACSFTLVIYFMQQQVCEWLMVCLCPSGFVCETIFLSSFSTLNKNVVRKCTQYDSVSLPLPRIKPLSLITQHLKVHLTDAINS